MRRVIFTLSFFIILYTINAQRTISGRIVENGTNDGVIGASILVLKGEGSDLTTYTTTEKGTVTDLDGRYELILDPGENAFLISYVGFESQRILVTTENIYNIGLKEDSELLNEVVVVGYGVQRKVDVTGSTASVKGEELAKQPVMTATQALQGKAAGVQIISSGEPGSNPIVRVRGVSSAIAGTATLFVVDGILTDDISNINTNDIVSMDILKDASSTAIYGARGANGVIIITTKRGLSGAMTVNFNSTVGRKNAANLVEMANSEEYANYVTQATGSPIINPGFSTDWYDQILRSAWYQTFNLSLSGGTEKSTYYISGGFLQDEGIVVNNKFKRFNLRSNLDFNVNKVVKLGLITSFTGANNKRVNLGTAYNNAYRAAPIIEAQIGDRYGNTSNYQNVGNPILDINNNDALGRGHRIQATGFIDVKPIDWITLRTSMGGELVSTSDRAFNYKFENDTTTFLNSGGNQRNPNSNLNIKKENYLRWVWDNTVTFNKKIDDHTFTLLVGTTAEQFSSDYVESFRKDVPADKNLWYIGAGDANTSTNNGGGDKWTRSAYLSRLNYNFDDKYLFTGTLRYDGSSRLSKENRWGLFPSVGAGWVISNEPFMENFENIDNLKFRTSWGKVGNDRVPTDAFVVTLEPNQNYPFGGGIALPGSAITQIKDPNLKWETTEELDFGLDFGFLKNRLTGEIGYYTKSAKDLLINVKVPSVVGDADGQVLTNAASIKNTGYEFALNWRTKSSERFSYSIGANATVNKNEVTGLNGGQPILDGGIGADQPYVTKTDNGHEVGEFYVLQVLGVFQDSDEVSAYKSSNGTTIQPSANAGDFKYQDTNGDGAIDDNDRVFLGSYQPKLYYGINFGFSFLDFDFSMDIYGNSGNKVYNGKKAFRQLATDNIERDIAYDRWSQGSGIQDEPGANSGRLPASSYFVEDGDFIRLNNVTISYNLPHQMMENLKMSSARIFLSGQNIYTYKKYSGFTAELPGDPTKSGIELNAYPTSRTIVAGVNLTF